MLWYDWTNESEITLPDYYRPARWGLSPKAIAGLGRRLVRVWKCYSTCFVTKTRDANEHAYTYLRGQLTMDAKRNFANVERRVTGGDGQALQHFMSNSPRSGQAVFAQIQADIRATPELARGGWLILDESADEKTGLHSAGTGRQHNGRLGKIGVCQVATCLTYAHPTVGVWTLIDGELFVPEVWFSTEYAEMRAQVELPAEREFATKPALGWRMLQCVKAAGRRLNEWPAMNCMGGIRLFEQRWRRKTSGMRRRCRRTRWSMKKNPGSAFRVDIAGTANDPSD